MCTHGHRLPRPRDLNAGLTTVHLDATSLKVLAHPLRSRLLSALRRGRPRDGDRPGRGALGTNSGATSYHLRKLESVGLVADTGEGEGKRRLWRAATESHQFDPSDFAGDEDAETALNWLARDYVRHFAEQSERWLDVEPTWPLEWRDACGISDDMVLVTADQLEAMRDEIDEVIARYRRVGQGNPQAKRIAVYLFAYPLDLDKAPQDEGSAHDRRAHAPLPPAAARRVFLTLSFTRWFPVGLVVGLFTLLPLERGLTVAQALTASRHERLRRLRPRAAHQRLRRRLRPTAGVHRRGGRQRPRRPWPTSWRRRSGSFALAACLMGVFRALDSGPLEAWFVDTVHATEPGADVDGALAAQGTVVGGGIASGALISGGLVWWHPFADQSALLLPVAIFVALNVVHLVAVLAPPAGAAHPRRRHRARRALQSAKEAPGVIRDGLSLLRRNRVLRGLVMVEVFWSVAMVVFETFQPIRLAELLGSEERAGALMGPVASAGVGGLRRRFSAGRAGQPPDRGGRARPSWPGC